MSRAREALRAAAPPPQGLELTVSRSGFSLGPQPLGRSSPVLGALSGDFFVRRVKRLRLPGDLPAPELRALLEVLLVPAEELAARGGAERYLRRRGVRHLELNEVDFSRLIEEPEPQEEEEPILELGESVLELSELAPAEPAAPPEEREDEVLRLLQALESERTENTYLEHLRPLVAAVRQRTATGDFRRHLTVLGTLVRHANDRERVAQVRRAALEGVRTIGERRVILKLVQDLTGPDKVALEALARVFAALWEPVTDPLIEALAKAGTPLVRRRVLFILRSLGDLIVPTLVMRLKDDRWFVARNAATVLGEIGRPKAVDPLGEALLYPDRRVRKEAVRALSKIGGDRARGYLLASLEGKDRAVQTYAAFALGQMREHGAVPALLRLLERRRTRRNLALLREVVRALGRIGSPEAAPALGSIYLRRPWWRPGRLAALRAEAATALGEAGVREGAERLAQGLGLASAELVEAAWAGLARLDELLS